MKNVNSFWQKTRETQSVDYGRSMTLPGLEIPLNELLASGEIDTVSEKIRKRMIFGKRIQINDLTDFDNFKKKVDHYKTLLKQKENFIVQGEKIEKEKKEVVEEVVNETVTT